MARASALHAEGREFESLTVLYHWSIRSSARMPPCHGGEAGSIPAWTATQRGGLELVPARSHKPNDTGSNPVPATKWI